jgi:hypothetical protein
MQAFNIAVGGWLVCGMLLAGLYLTVERDEDRMQAILLEEIELSTVRRPFSPPG